MEFLVVRWWFSKRFSFIISNNFIIIVQQTIFEIVDEFYKLNLIFIEIINQEFI